MRPSCRQTEVGQQGPCLASRNIERLSRDDPGFKPAKERQLEASHGTLALPILPRNATIQRRADPVLRFLYVPGGPNKKNNRRVYKFQAVPSRPPSKIETVQTTHRTREMGGDTQ